MDSWVSPIALSKSFVKLHLFIVKLMGHEEGPLVHAQSHIYSPTFLIKEHLKVLNCLWLELNVLKGKICVNTAQHTKKQTKK